jgi:hypothetical protein
MGRRQRLGIVVVLASLSLVGCRRHRHRHDAGAEVPGALPGTTAIPGVMPGQSIPGNVPPGTAPPGAGLMVPAPVQTTPDNPTQPVPPPGVMRVLPNAP